MLLPAQAVVGGAVEGVVGEVVGEAEVEAGAGVRLGGVGGEGDGGRRESVGAQDTRPRLGGACARITSQ